MGFAVGMLLGKSRHCRMSRLHPLLRSLGSGLEENEGGSGAVWLRKRSEW